MLITLGPSCLFLQTIAARGFKFMTTTEIAFCAMRMYSHFRRTEVCCLWVLIVPLTVLLAYKCYTRVLPFIRSWHDS